MSDEQTFAALIAQAEGKQPRSSPGAGGEIPGASPVSPSAAPEPAGGDESAFAHAIAAAEGRKAPAAAVPATAPAPLPARLDALAQLHGLKKTSGKRDPARNARAGGAKGSLHLADGVQNGAFDYAGDPKAMRAFAEQAKNELGNDLYELYYDGYGRYKRGKALPTGKDHHDHVHVSWRADRKPATEAAESGQTYGPPVATRTVKEIERQETLIAELERKSKIAHDRISALMTGPQARRPDDPAIQAELAKIRGTDADLKRNGGKPLANTYNARVLAARARLEELQKVQGVAPLPEAARKVRVVRDPLTGIELPFPDSPQARQIEGVANFLDWVGQNPVVQAVTRPLKNAQELVEQVTPDGHKIRGIREQQEKARANAPRVSELPGEDAISQGARNLAQTFNPFGQAGRELDLRTARAAQSRVESAARALPVPGTEEYRKHAGDVKAAATFLDRFLPIGGNRPSKGGVFDPFNVGAANSYRAEKVREIIRSAPYQKAYSALSPAQKRYADAMALVKLVQDGESADPTGLAELAGTVADFGLFRALRPLAAQGGAATTGLAQGAFGAEAAAQAMQTGVVGSLQRGGARQWVKDSLIRGLAEVGSEATFTAGFESASRAAQGKPGEMAQGGLQGLQSGAAGALSAALFPKLAGSGPVRRYLQGIPGGALEEGIQEVTQSLLEGERDPKKLQGVFLGAAAFGGLFSAGAGAMAVAPELRSDRAAARVVASEVAKKALELQQVEDDAGKLQALDGAADPDQAYDELTRRLGPKRIEAAQEWLVDRDLEAQAAAQAEAGAQVSPPEVGQGPAPVPHPSASPTADPLAAPLAPAGAAPGGETVLGGRRQADAAMLDPVQAAPESAGSAVETATPELSPTPGGAQHEHDFSGAFSGMDLTGKYAEDAFARLSSGKAMLFSERPGSLEAKIQDAWELGQIADPADIALISLDHFNAQAAGQEQVSVGSAAETSTPAGPQFKRSSGVNVAPDAKGGFKLGDGSKLTFAEASDLAELLDGSDADAGGEVIEALGIDRYMAALDTLEKVQGLDALDEFRQVFRQYGGEQEAAQNAELEAEARRSMQETGTDGRGLIERAYGSGGDKYGNTVVPESYTEQDLELIYEALQTSGRENTRGGKMKRYQTSAGTVDLESLVKNLRMIPADAYAEKQRATKKAQAAAKSAQVVKEGAAAPEQASVTSPAETSTPAPVKPARGHAVSVQVDGETRIVELDAETRAKWDAEAERHRVAIESIKGGASVGKAERLRKEGFVHAENKRKLTGQFTAAETRAQAKADKTIGPGKAVLVKVGGKAREGRVTAAVFGKVTVQLNEGGKVTVPRAQVILDREPATVRAAAQGGKQGEAAPVRRVRTIQSAGDVERAALEHGFDKEQAKAAGVYFDRMARGWAKSYGRKREEFFREHVAGIEIQANRERVGVSGDYTARTAQGAIDFTADGRALIQLFDNANASTLIHEGAHLMRRILSGADQAILAEWAGVEGDNWTTEAEEKVARGLERVIRDGDFAGMAGGVRKVFERLRDWFLDLYQAVEGSSLDLDVSPEVREVFARALDLRAGKAAGAPVRTEARAAQAPRTVEPKAAPKLDRAKLDSQLAKEEAELAALLGDNPLFQSAEAPVTVNGKAYYRLDYARAGDAQNPYVVLGETEQGKVEILSRHADRAAAKAGLERLVGGEGKPLFQESEPETGKPFAFEYLRNPALGGPSTGFGQELEPKGRYLTEKTAGSRVPEGWETGRVEFRNPLVVAADGWKAALSQQFGGKTGDALSRAVLAAGYDGIVTQDKHGTGEIVDLTRYRKAPLKQEAEEETPAGPVYYSQARRVIESKFPAKGSTEQLRGILSGGAVKSDELKWSGLDEFLAEKSLSPVEMERYQASLQVEREFRAEGEPVPNVVRKEIEAFKARMTFTRAEVLAHLDANEVRVEEVVYSEAGEKRAEQVSELQDEINRFGLVDLAWQADMSQLEAANLPNRLREGRVRIEDLPEDVQGPAQEWLELNRELEALQAQKAEGAPRYSSMTLPGGKGYRELLLTLPESESPEVRAQRAKAQELQARAVADPSVRAERDAAEAELARLWSDSRAPRFHTSHWNGEKNVLAHVRFDERETPDGAKVLFLAELQSDWHQAGRKQGYREEKLPEGWSIRPVNDGDRFALRQDGLNHGTFATEADATAYALRMVNDEKVAPAPLAKTWHETVFRRMARWGAENGFARLTWPATAEQVAEVEHWGGSFRTEEKDGEPSYFVGVQNVTAIVNRYLVDLPRYASKWGKKFGAQVTKGAVNVEGKAEAVYRGPEWTQKDLAALISSQELTAVWTQQARDVLGGMIQGQTFQAAMEEHASPGLAVRFGGSIGLRTPTDSAEVHSLEITPAMRRTALEGIPLFQEQEQAALADLNPGDTNSPEFKRWFGKSKVVDAEGAPLVVYKGMWPYDWTKEEGNDLGPEVDRIQRTTEFPAFHHGEPGIRIAGFFGDQSTANHFARNGSVYPVYLSLQNPYIVDAKGKPAGVVQFGATGAPFREAVRSGKYDGVIIRNTADEGTIYVALQPEQIKSVNNRGTWDPEDARILFQEAKLPEAVAEKLARIGAIRYARGTQDFDAWTEELAGVAGEGFRKHAAAIWPMAQEIYRQELQAETEAANKAVEPKYIGSLNEVKLRQSGVEEEIIELIRDDYEQNRGIYDAHRRTGASWADADAGKAAAVKQLIKEGVLGAEQRPGRAYNDVELNALASMHVRLSDEVYRAKEAYSAEDTTANRALLLEAETRFQAISLALQGASAEAGRALNIHRKLKQALADHIPMRLVERALSVEKTPAREKTAKSPQGRPAKLADKDFGAENRLVTATETRSKLRFLKDALKSRPLFQDPADAPADEASRQRPEGSPVPPELWDDLVVAGLGLREGGYRRKDGWKRIMRSELGELSDQALDEIWTATKGEAKKRAVKQLTQKDLATKKLKQQLERAGLSEDEIKALVEDFDANVPENDPVAMIEYLRKRGKMTAGAMLNSYWKANVLSGVRTQARNLLDNALNGALATLERPVVAGVDAVRSKLTGEPRTYYAGETLPAMVGGLVGSVDGVKQGLQVLRRGYSDRALENMDYPQELPGGGKNPWNWVGRSLEASDQFSGAMAERSEIHAGAVRTAMQEKLAGEAFKARVKELIASPTPEMRESAEAFRKHATYRNDPDAFVKLILKIRGATAFGPQHNLPILPSMGKFKGVQLPLEGFSLADPILPFVLTPWNVLKTSLEFTPGVGLAKLTDSEFRKSSEASKLIARQLMGAAVVKMLWGVAAAGLMTSGWPEDEKERDEWKRLGIQPYSFKVGGTWYSYQQSGPLKLALTTMAEFHNWTKKGKERDLGEKLAQAVSSIGHSMVDSSFLSGLNGFVSALTTPERSAERFAAGIAGGFVPFSGLTRNVADAVDRRERDPKGFGERLASGIPGLSGKVPGKIDGFGAVQQKAGGRASAFLASAPSKESTDAVQQQLRRLGVRPITPGDEIAAGKLTRSQHAELLQRSGQAQLAAARDYLTGPGATAGITSEHQAERVRTKMKEAADAARKDYLRELNDRKAEAAAKLARGKPTR